MYMCVLRVALRAQPPVAMMLVLLPVAHAWSPDVVLVLAMVVILSARMDVAEHLDANNAFPHSGTMCCGR